MGKIDFKSLLIGVLLGAALLPPEEHGNKVVRKSRQAGIKPSGSRRLFVVGLLGMGSEEDSK